MLEPFSATAILISFLVIWAIIIPIFGAIPKVKNVISYRYLILTVFLACMIGVVINYHDLDSSIKLGVVVGTTILCGVYIIIRSFEKWLANGWRFNKDIEASVQKGEIKAEIKLKDTGDKENESTQD